MIVDFRLRPPFGGFLQAAIYTQRERSAAMGAAMGFEPPLGASSQRTEDTFREMDEGGIHVGVIPVKCGNPGFFGDVSNDEVAAFVAQHPDRFVGFAGPNLAEPKIGLEEIERLAPRPEFRGFVFEPGLWPKALYADDRSYYPLYERCQSLGVPALFMAGGNAGPDVDHTAPGIIDRICRDFPKLTVIAGHGGWPWVHQVLHVAYRRPNLYLSPDMYVFGMAGWRDYVDAGNGYLQDRFIFGTAYPTVPLGPAVKRFKEMFREGVHAKLLGENALRVLGISESDRKRFERPQLAR